MKTNWRTYWLNKNNRIILVVSFAVLALVLLSFVQVLTYVENRKGVVFNDPVLNLLPAIDLSLIIFISTYSIAVCGIILIAPKPELFLKLVQVYTILILLRMLSLFLVPLEPPVAIIPLDDILLKSTFYSGRPNLKDLFFSGHVAMLLILALVLANNKFKWFFVCGAIVVGILIMLQHVHYSIDVFAAPAFAYLAFIAQKKITST